jgi:recombination protein RecT
MKANGEGYQGAPQGQGNLPARPAGTGMKLVKDLVNDDYVKAKFQEILGEKAPAFLASVVNATNTNKQLSTCEPKSVLSAALVAASLDLPIDQNLGFAAIVPYKDNKSGGVMKAQFQIMYKGFIQLGQRTGQYQTMNVTPVYADEIKKHDPITGEVVIEAVPDGDRENDREEKIVGYAAYFRLINGFEKTEYWTIKKLEAHGKKYSKSYSGKYPDSSLWSTNKPAMFSKTVLKALISKWGIMSTTMQTAVVADQAVVKSMDGGFGKENMDYTDSPDADDIPHAQDQQTTEAADLAAKAGTQTATPVENRPTETTATPEAKQEKSDEKPAASAEKKSGAQPEMNDWEAQREMEFPEPPDAADGPDIF